MRSNREASVKVLVPIVIAVLHRRITVEIVVDVWGHIRSRVDREGKCNTEANF
jgi:hypothetical protein